MTKKPTLFVFLVLLATCLGVGAVTSVQAACPDGSVVGLTSYWTLDELVTGTYGDSVDSNHGVGAVSPVPGTGIVNGAQGFNRASGTGINVPADASFDWSETENFSIEFWMKGMAGVTCDGTAISDNEVMIGRDDSSSDLHWWLGCVRNTRAARFMLQATNNESVQLDGGPALDDELWHHIVGVRDADNNRVLLYVDSIEVDRVDTAVFTAGFDSASAFLSLGWLNLNPFFRFNGYLDEVAIYDRVLTDAEITQHYNGRLGESYCGTLARYALTMNTAGTGAGSVNPAGGVYQDGLALQLTPNPSPGSAFNEWSGDLTGNANPETLVMDSDKDVTATFDLDFDSDGIGDVEENNAPNGGDGDSSGILDSAESNVCSLNTFDGQSYVTLVSPAGTTLTSVRATTPPSGGPAGITFPWGFFSFQVNGLAFAGAPVTVSVILHNGDTPTTYYKFGPEPGDASDHFYEFIFDGSTGAEIAGNQVTLNFVDGDQGDDDLLANQVIVDQGGPGSPPPAAESSGGGGGGGGCFIATAANGS
jgi:hypothetical protein